MEKNVLNFQNQEEQDEFCEALKVLLENAYNRKIESEEDKRFFLELNVLLGIIVSIPAISQKDILLLIIALSLAIPSWILYKYKGEKIEYFKEKTAGCDREFNLNKYQKDFSEEEIREMISEAVNRILERDKIEI